MIFQGLVVFLNANFHLRQAWGVLEQRVGNLSAARQLFRSSLNINSQSYITWMTWASLEEDQGNPVRAEEIRNLYFQQVSDFCCLLLVENLYAVTHSPKYIITSNLLIHMGFWCLISRRRWGNLNP